MFEILPQSKNGNIAVKASGVISKSDYEAHLPELHNMVDQVLKFRLMLDWGDLEGWEEDAIPVSFGLRIGHQLRCERIAVLSDDPRQQDDLKKLQGLLMIRDFRVFPPAERDSAWSWLTN